MQRLQEQPAHEECTFKPKLIAKPKELLDGNTGDRSVLTAVQQIGGPNGPIKEVDESQELNTSTNVFDRLTVDAQISSSRQRGREIAEMQR